MKNKTRIRLFILAAMLIIFSFPLTAFGAVRYDPLVDRYGIPEEFGVPQYSQAEIQEMIDSNLTLDEVADRISTISDFIQYIHLKGFGSSEIGDLKLRVGDYRWGFNRTAQTVFNENEGDCGGDSNLANYILRDDYTSQGYVQEDGYKGGHIYNYFKQGDLYCFIDFTRVVGKGGYDDRSYQVYVTESPASYSEYYINEMLKNDSTFVINSCRIQCMYPQDGDHLPMAHNRNETYFPEYAKDIIVTLYSHDSTATPGFISVKGVEFTEEAALEDMKAFEQERKSSFSAEETKEIMSQMKFGCDAEKTKKGSIKVSTEKVPGTIAKLRNDGYTIKYKFYRSTKKSSGYKRVATKDKGQCTFTSGTKGTKYYFKVVVTASKDGKTYSTKLKNCKYTSAIR